MALARPALSVAALAALLVACSAESPAPSTDEASRAADAAAPPPGSSSASLATGSNPAREKPALSIEGDGLRLVDRQTGRARSLTFGLSRPQIMEALTFLGAPAETGLLSECGAGPVDRAAWRNGLTVYFQHNRFTGWALRPPEGAAGQAALTTASNIGLGSTRAQLESAYETEVSESSLGTEFAAGKLSGLLDGAGPQARIAHLWAGTNCVMR